MVRERRATLLHQDPAPSLPGHQAESSTTAAGRVRRRSHQDRRNDPTVLQEDAQQRPRDIHQGKCPSGAEDDDALENSQAPDSTSRQTRGAPLRALSRRQDARQMSHVPRIVHATVRACARRSGR